MTISVVRSFADEVALARLRGGEAQRALAGLAADPAAMRLTGEVVSNGAAFTEPFDALRHLAQREGQRGLLDGFTKSGAMEQVLARATRSAPNGSALAAVERARDAAGAAQATIDHWLYASGRPGSIDGVVSAARSHLAEAMRSLRSV